MLPAATDTGGATKQEKKKRKGKKPNPNPLITWVKITEFFFFFFLKGLILQYQPITMPTP